MLESPALGPRDAAAQIPEGARHLIAAGVSKSWGWALYQEQGCLPGRAVTAAVRGARINTVPGSSLLQAAPPRPLHFQKDGKEHFPVEMVTTDGSHVT